MTGDFHEFLYADPKRVRQARIQAEGRIASRKLKRAVLAPFERLALWIVDWIDSRS